MEDYILITGGAGFIGTNLAERFLSAGERVAIFDNLSRDGVRENLEYLTTLFPIHFQFIQGDLRSFKEVENAVENAKAVFHLAAQISYTTSLENPLLDFEANAKGSLHVLEALRLKNKKIPCIYASTSEVLGDLSSVALEENETRYEPSDHLFRASGISEKFGICSQGPNACSKATGEQYFLDYFNTFDIPTIVFRLSCVYGPHQWGNSDQGWAAYFLRQLVAEKEITLCGNGKQVRDLLYITDLVDALTEAWKMTDKIAGQLFHIGGGRERSVSFLEAIQMMAEIHGKGPVKINFEKWRVGDQRYYVSDYRKWHRVSGWSPKVNTAIGLQSLYDWLLEASALANQPPHHPNDNSSSLAQSSL